MQLTLAMLAPRVEFRSLMKEPESKANYWPVVGLVLWSAVILLILYLVGHFLFRRW